MCVDSKNSNFAYQLDI